MKTKLTIIATILMLAGATSAVALQKPTQAVAPAVDAQVEALAAHIEALAPRVSNLDRPL